MRSEILLMLKAIDGVCNHRLSLVHELDRLALRLLVTISQLTVTSRVSRVGSLEWFLEPNIFLRAILGEFLRVNTLDASQSVIT